MEPAPQSDRNRFCQQEVPSHAGPVRGEGMSHADELIAAFNKARQPKEQIAALEQIIRSYQQFKQPENQLQPIIVTIENMAARNQKMHPELAFELIMARDDLLGRIPSLHTTHIGSTLSKLILDEEKRLISILPKLPAAKEKRILKRCRRRSLRTGRSAPYI